MDGYSAEPIDLIITTSQFASLIGLGRFVYSGLSVCHVGRDRRDLIPGCSACCLRRCLHHIWPEHSGGSPSACRVGRDQWHDLL